MPICAPIGDNQLRPAMSVNPRINTVSTFTNPFGTNTTMYVANTQVGVSGAAAGNSNPLSTSGGLSAGTGDFTIELWMYMTAPPAITYTISYEQSHGGLSVSVYSNYTINLSQSFVSDLWRSNTALTLNTWTNVAWTRAGSNSKLFINGTLDSYRTLTNNFQQTTGWDAAYIGGGIVGGGNVNWTGYLCEVRLSNIERYSANYTPSTTPFKDDANTLLLVHGGSNGLTAISDDNT